MDREDKWELGRQVSYFNGTLRKLRLERGLLQKDVADAVGVKSVTISGYETMKAVPSEEIMEKIAKFFNVSAEQIFPEYLKMLTSKAPYRSVEYAHLSTQALEDFSRDTLRLQAGDRDPEKQFRMQEIRGKINSALDCLSDREKKIVCMHYGLGQDAQTLEEIGDYFCVTRDRIRQIEQRALNKLQKNRHIIEIGEWEDIAA